MSENVKSGSNCKWVQVLEETKDNFWISCFFVILLPLLPLYLEYSATTKISTTSLALTSSFFALTSAASSKIKSFFAVYIVMGFSFSSILYIHQGKEDYVTYISIYVILYVCSCNVIERYIRHIQREPHEKYLTFFHGKEDIKERREHLKRKEKELNNKLGEILEWEKLSGELECKQTEFGKKEQKYTEENKKYEEEKIEEQKEKMNEEIKKLNRDIEELNRKIEELNRKIKSIQEELQKKLDIGKDKNGEDIRTRILTKKSEIEKEIYKIEEKIRELDGE